MAELRAFRGLRYSVGAGALESLLAPPYDVVGPEMRERLAAASPHNFVHLSLPEALPDDRSQFVKYARSAARLEEWRREGVLTPEPSPCLYRLTQTFTTPGPGTTRSRTALVCLIRVQPYSDGVVLPHEQTFPKHKEDRLRILEATRAHLESIFGLYEDDDGTLDRAVREAPGEVVAEATTGFDGVRHRFEALSDGEAVSSLLARFAAQRVWIADGHHRYETALQFRAQARASESRIAEDFMMIALTSMMDPGLVLLPTHRILNRLGCRPEEIAGKLEDAFEIEPVPNASIPARLKDSGRGTLGVALPGGAGFLAKVRDLAALTKGMAGGERLRTLDVSLLHGPVFRDRLGLEGLDFFGYTRDDQEALSSVEQGAPAAFLMSPPSVDDMRAVSLNQELMPQKSTYYHPKLPSGLVLWSLNDF